MVVVCAEVYMFIGRCTVCPWALIIWFADRYIKKPVIFCAAQAKMFYVKGQRKAGSLG